VEYNVVCYRDFYRGVSVMVIEHIFLSETLNNIVVLKQNTYSTNVINITLITEHGEDKVNLSDVDELVKNLKLNFISMGVVCD
jgi:hypothetical protein